MMKILKSFASCTFLMLRKQPPKQQYYHNNHRFAVTAISFLLQSRQQGHYNNSRRMQTRRMTSAYSGEPGDGRLDLSKVSSYIPYRTTLKNGMNVEVGPFQECEWSAGMDLMNLIIREGKSWPFEEEFPDETAYRSYFLSHTAFVVRSLQPPDEGKEADAAAADNNRILGTFYIKPNFPGRCSHICNGGFITNPHYRQLGVGSLMGHVFLQVAKDLGYQSSYFNLVFRSNTASIQLWESLGFERVATLENAARLTGVEGLDTAYGYLYDLTQLPENYLVNNVSSSNPSTQE